jgi:hypothetical protein
VDTRNFLPTRTGLPQDPLDVESDAQHPRGEPGDIRLHLECCNPGEDRYEGTLVFPSQVLLSGLDDTVETLLKLLVGAGSVAGEKRRPAEGRGASSADKALEKGGSGAARPASHLGGAGLTLLRPRRPLMNP